MNDMLKMVKDTLATTITKANEVVAQISAATTDKGKVVHEYRTDPNTTDEKIKAHQEWVEKAEAEIERRHVEIGEYIKEKYLSGEGLTDEQIEALKSQHKELKTAVSTARKFAETVPGYTEDIFSDLPELKNLRGGSVSDGSGTGGKRPRIERIWVNDVEVDETGKNAKGEDVVKTNFTIAAKYIAKDAGTKVEVKDLQAAAFEAAKTDDLSTLNGRVFDFGYSVNGKTYMLKVQPQVKPTAEANTEAPAEAEAEVTA